MANLRTVFETALRDPASEQRLPTLAELTAEIEADHNGEPPACFPLLEALVAHIPGPGSDALRLGAAMRRPGHDTLSSEPPDYWRAARVASRRLPPGVGSRPAGG